MPLPEPPVVIEFRDGERSVPAFVASNIAVAGIDPLAFTFEEARAIADKAIERNFINNAQQRMIRSHFVENR